MTRKIIRPVALAAALALTAGGALAQAPSSRSTAATLGYSAAPLNGQGYAYRNDGDLTVMGMTGAVQPKYPEATGSITRLPPAAWSVRAR